MTDVYSGHSQFVLLGNNRRRWFDGRTLFIITVITVPVIIFCGIYTVILKTNETLLYPQSHIEVPVQAPHRAKIYSTRLRNLDKGLLSIEDDVPKITDFKLVCYYNFPGGSGSLQPEKIDPFLCTHINVGFARVGPNGVELTQDQLRALQTVVGLKQVNGNLKVLVSVGGAGNDGGFNVMVLSHASRKVFIRSVAELVRNHSIDGVDLDWEFPNETPGRDKKQKVHFVQLLEEFRMTINKYKEKFLVTVAVAAPIVLVDNCYDVPYLNEFVDFVNVMAYDYHFYTKLTPFTGLNSPLYPSIEDKGYLSTLNINFTAFYWVSKGMAREKLVIGLPTYGHTFRLTNIHNSGLYAPARGYGKLGSGGFVDYSQVCSFLNMNQISPIFDMDAKSPYATKGTEWVAFDNEQSLSFKAEFVRDNQFGGVMVYSLNADDYLGVCKVDSNVQSRQFPLINKVKEILDRNYSIF
ncbi:chitinase-3-like protein 2 [Tribolium madens]|uniref:chitinase-3-like protein 2 n=1 Tax=Tribolium madens TaxID=41895 RepID=UPI001CF73DF5|nr:chitinase-3-like protein 2 [Tribolium madens]